MPGSILRKFSLPIVIGFVTATFVTIGCGQQQARRADFSKTLSSVAGEPAATASNVNSVVSAQNPPTSSDSPAGQADATTPNPTAPAIQRRIVYTTDIGLVVKDYAEFESSLPGTVERMGGYISKSETNRRYANQQAGVWVARVPVARYGEFLQGVAALGFAESRREDAQDVTEEYVDVEARIRNNHKLEERIITMLQDRTGKLTDVLEIERELARVREEVERMEGRLRLLADRSAMATVTIRCREEQQYTPPEAPTFASRIASSWSGSIESLRSTGESLLIAMVSLAPWLMVLAIPVLVAWRLVRRLLPLFKANAG